MNLNESELTKNSKINYNGSIKALTIKQNDKAIKKGGHFHEKVHYKENLANVRGSVSCISFLLFPCTIYTWRSN